MKIADYWIDEIKEIQEFKAISEAEEPEFQALAGVIESMIDDQFIETATEKGIARREKILNIQPFADDTLDTRKFRVSALSNNRTPYTIRMLENRLNNLVGENGYNMELNNDEYTLTISVNLGVKRMLQDTQRLARSTTPANLIVSVVLQYNRYQDLNQFTHSKLSTKTHFEIREEVLY